LGDEFGSAFVVVELGVGELGRPDRRADELTLSALVGRAEEQLASRIVDDLELAVILEDVLEYKLLLRGVFRVAARDLVLELALGFKLKGGVVSCWWEYLRRKRSIVRFWARLVRRF
jgi:hypothetical protein